MVELDNISNVGFGTYRLLENSELHEKALRLALNLGCNLIDTSSNYTNGQSERLVGKVIKDHKTFVVSKAGYISNENLDLYNQEISKGVKFTDIVDISPDFKHSISPDYLKHQLSISFNRMDVKNIDCFLLHNPEYYFKSSNDKDFSKKEYYSRIYKAFEFLEDQVKKGFIRYYGISSNTFAVKNKTNSTDLKEILKIAEKISSSNHFKFIQFPFNFIENQATEEDYIGDKNLIEFAKIHGIKCISNRPLNANIENDNLKLISMNKNIDNLIIENQIASFLTEIQIILDTKGFKENIDDIKVLYALKTNWVNMIDATFLKKFINQYIQPLLNQITDNNIPTSLILKLEEVSKVLNERILYIQTNKTRDFLLKNYNLDIKRIENVPSYMIKKYLDLGIDHVLVGMRNINYVNQLKALI